MPAGPEPITATFLPERRLGFCGCTKPLLNAISIICFSISSIATGGWLIPNTQADSQGAGHIRPVNSGKLFVEFNISYASNQSLRYTASLNSGIMFPKGQPLWQKGTPQSIQRADCSFSFCSL